MPSSPAAIIAAVTRYGLLPESGRRTSSRPCGMRTQAERLLSPYAMYAGAQVAHSRLPTARMVVVQGGGNHGQSLESPADGCVQGYLNRYLASGALPSQPGAVNATCAPPPDPAPVG